MADPTLRPENLAETLARVLPDARILFPSEPHPGDLLHIAVPKACDVRQVDTEFLLDNPRRTKATATFASPSSFVDYVARFAQPSTIVWCEFDPQTYALQFVAVIDDHGAKAPGWRGHRAVFKPDMSREWKTWQASNGEAMSQVAFAEFLQDNQDDIVADEEDKSPTSLQMLAMATDFIAQQENMLKSSVRLASGGVRLTYIEDADKETTATMQVFERFTLGIPVFQGLGGWKMKARLKYRVKQGAVSFFYELVRPDRVHGAAAKTLIDEVRGSLISTPMYLGVCP